MAMMAQPLARAQWNAGWESISWHPGVHEELLFLHEHAVGELQDLPRRVVVVPRLARELPGLREAGHAHVEIVQPQRVRQRAIARQRAVLQAELPRCTQSSQLSIHGRSVLEPSPARCGLDQRRAHGAGVVESRRQQHPAQRDAVRRARVVSRSSAGRELLACVRGELRDGGHALIRVLVVARIAGDLREQHHAGIRHAPLVRNDLQVGARQRHLWRQLRKIRHRLARLAIQHAHRRGLGYVGVDALEQCAHLLRRGELIRRGYGTFSRPEYTPGSACGGV